MSDENDNDDDDKDSMKILAPQSAKVAKETFNNEYDEACSKLQLNA